MIYAQLINSSRNLCYVTYVLGEVKVHSHIASMNCIEYLFRLYYKLIDQIGII